MVKNRLEEVFIPFLGISYHIPDLLVKYVILRKRYRRCLCDISIAYKIHSLLLGVSLRWLTMSLMRYLLVSDRSHKQLRASRIWCTNTSWDLESYQVSNNTSRFILNSVYVNGLCYPIKFNDQDLMAMLKFYLSLFQ